MRGIELPNAAGGLTDSTLVRVLFAGKAGAVIEHAGFRLVSGPGFGHLHGLRTWGEVEAVKGESVLRIAAMPGRHAPGPLAWLFPDVMGSMLEFGDRDGRSACRMYISGDTLCIGEGDIPRRRPEIDLALARICGTRILGLLMVTVDAAKRVRALRTSRQKKAIPVPSNDSTVFSSPLEDFTRAMAAASLPVQIVVLRRGERCELQVPGLG